MIDTNTRATEAQQIDTVRNHGAIKKDNVAQPECWAAFAAEFATVEGPAFLQPGQFIPLWNIHRGQWKLQTPFKLHVTSAYARDGRYMVVGGSEKLGSHPKISAWDAGVPMPGKTGELRNPGGLRTIELCNIPAIMANGASFQSRRYHARMFHDEFAEASLHEGCPIRMICRSDKANPSGIPFAAHVMYDVLRGDATCGYEIPIPVITSNEEEIILRDYPEWDAAIDAFCAEYKITEIGVLYAAHGVDEIEDSISSKRPNQVFRNAIIKGDIGFSTLDPNLYERMLPFATGSLDKAFLPRL
jgi:hypothetical protein